MVAIKYPTFSLGVSTGGNTDGQTGITGSQVVLAGVGNITLSQVTDANGGTISISGSGGGGGGGDFSAGISGGNTAGATGLTGSSVALAGGNNITLSGATDAFGGTITVVGPTTVAQSVQTQDRFDLTIDGNTAGAGQLVSSGTLSLAGGSNITLSQNGNAISIIGGAGETQTAISGIANSETTYTSGTVNLSGLGAITVRSTTGNAFQLSVNAQSVQPETQTFLGGVAASNTTYTSGTVSIVGSGNVTVQSGTGQRVIINASQSVQPETQTFVGGIAASDTTYTSGTVRFSGVGGGVTVSSNTGQRVDISVAAQSAQTGISSIVASDATYTSGSVQFTGSNMVTVRSSANQRVVIDATQSVQTQNLHNVTISGNTAGAGAAISSGTLTLAGGNNITISQAGNALTISGANAAGAQTAISGLANSQTTYTSGTVSLSELGAITIRSTTGNQFQFSVNAQSVQPETQTFVGGLANSQTTYTSGTVSLSELGAITIRSTTGNQFQLSVNAQSVQPETQTFVGGIIASDTTYTSGSIRFTGVGGGVTVSSNTGQRVDISVAAQSVESQSIGMSNVGNTSGTTGVASGGQVRFVLAGGNNITLSQSLNGASGTLTISAFNQTVESQSIGMSNIGNTSGTTGIASGAQVRFVFAGGNNVTLSQSLNGASGTITISGPNTAAQSVQTLGMYAVQNTTGQSSSTTMDARTLSVAGDGIVSVGYSGGSLRISASQSVQAETQTFIGGIANTETTYTSGTVKLLELGAITVRSTTGNQFQLSVNAQTNQSEGWYALGNTTGQSSSTTLDARTISIRGDGIVSVGYSGGSLRISASQSVQPETQTFIAGLANTETTYSSGTVKLLELGAITIRSTTGNQFQLSVNAQTGTQFSAGISGGNTSGDTGTVPGRVVLAGGNNITLSGSTNGSSMTITISGGAGGAFSGGVSNVGNTSGDTGITGSRLVLSGGQSVTLSQSTNASGATVMISGASTSQSVQSLGMYAVQNTTGQSSSTTMDARTLSIAGDGAVSVGYSGGSLRISAPVQSAQTGISGIANSQTTYTSGTVSLSELGAITIRSTTGNQYQFSVAAQTAESQSIGMSNIGNTSGTTGIASGAQVRMLFAGGNNITLSQSLNGASGTITISAPNQSAQTGISGIANSQTTYTSGTVSMSELGAITIRSTTGNQYQFSVNAQTGTQFSAGLSNIGNTSGDTVTNGGRMILAGGNGITLSGSSNGISQTITISGITQSVESQSIGMSNVGNTSGTTGIASGGQVRFVFAGGNNITLSQSLNGASGTITISAPNLGAGAMSVGLSTGGNTAGSTGATGTRLVLVASGAISGSQSTDANGGTITFNDTVSAFQLGVSTDGNTAGATGVTGTRFVLVGSSPISLSQTTGANGGTVTINAPATSSLVGTNGIVISTNGSTISVSLDDDLADWENMPRAQASLMTHVSAFSKTPIYWNDHIDGGILAKSLAFAISMVTASQPLSLSVHLGVYTLVNSTSANLRGSLSEAYVVSSASSVSLSGVRNLVMTGIGTHTALSSITGGEYMLGMMFSATATNAMNFSLLGASGGAGALGGIYPGTNNLSTGTSQGIQVLAGRGSTTVNAMPSAVSAADLVNQGQGASMPLHPWIYIRS